MRRSMMGSRSGARAILAFAIGAASEEREATTNDRGRATFEGLPVGATAIAMVGPDARTESVAVGGDAVGVIVLAASAAAATAPE